MFNLIFTSRKPEAKRFRKWVTTEVLPEIRKTGGYRRPETEFAGLSGERVEYERWLLERALLDAKLIALSMQSIGVHFERMATDDEDFGAARADTNYADYERELRENVYRSREFIRHTQPGSFFNHAPKPAAPSPEPSSKSSYPNEPLPLSEPAPAKLPLPALPCRPLKLRKIAVGAGLRQILDFGDGSAQEPGLSKLPQLDQRIAGVIRSSR